MRRTLLFSLLLSLAYAQTCNLDDFVIGKNGKTFLKITSTGGLALGTDAALSALDTVSINGSIRLSSNGPRPPCTGPSRGMIWLQNGESGVADQLFVCTKIVNAGTETFVWRNVFLGVTAGRVNGPELRDPWGFTWDGFNRRANTWDEANTQCLSIGARLPAVSELFRNNQGSGTAAISDYTAASPYLWTLIPATAVGAYVQVRLYDGAITTAAGTSAGYYRCVWPLTPEGNSFTTTNCNGPAGRECLPVGNFFNVDRTLRPPLPFISAVEECKFFGGSLPTLPELQLAINTPGLPVPPSWVWANNIATNVGAGSYYLAGVQWRTTPDISWSYTSGLGTYLATTTAYSFVCIGKRPELPGYLPVNAPCNGGCFTLTGTKSRILADSANRNATTFPQAVENCRAIGGAIPSFGQAADLIHGGWQNFTSTYLWMSEYYWYAGVNSGLFQWPATGVERWTAGTNMVYEAAISSNYEYRCIWPETFEATPTTCSATQATMNSGTALSCVNSVRGNANGRSFPNTDFPDIWGYAWDLQQRAAATYESAKNTCLSNGGRLPFPGEIWRVRATNYPNNIGDNTATSYLWTAAPSYNVDSYATIRVSDGVVTIAASTASNPFRCVWPPVPQGDVFGSRACFGDPTDPCVTIGRMRIDRYDRAAVPWPTALYECNALGGSLPTMQQYNTLLAGGLTNGTNAWIWVNHPITYYTSTASASVLKWTGVSSNATLALTSYRSYAATSNNYNYRCIWTDEYTM